MSTRILDFPLILRCPLCDGCGFTVRPVCCGHGRQHGEEQVCCEDPVPEQEQCNCPPERTVQVHAVLNRVSGEPGSLSITEGWEIDRCHVKYPDGAEVVATDEKQIDQAVREAAGKLQR